MPWAEMFDSIYCRSCRRQTEHDTLTHQVTCLQCGRINERRTQAVALKDVHADGETRRDGDNAPRIRTKTSKQEEQFLVSLTFLLLSPDLPAFSHVRRGVLCVLGGTDR